VEVAAVSSSLLKAPDRRCQAEATTIRQAIHTIKIAMSWNWR